MHLNVLYKLRTSFVTHVPSVIGIEHTENLCRMQLLHSNWWDLGNWTVSLCLYAVQQVLNLRKAKHVSKMVNGWSHIIWVSDESLQYLPSHKISWWNIWIQALLEGWIFISQIYIYTHTHTHIICMLFKKKQQTTTTKNNSLDPWSNTWFYVWKSRSGWGRYCFR